MNLSLGVLHVTITGMTERLMVLRSAILITCLMERGHPPTRSRRRQPCQCRPPACRKHLVLVEMLWVLLWPVLVVGEEPLALEASFPQPRAVALKDAAGV